MVYTRKFKKSTKKMKRPRMAIKSGVKAANQEHKFILRSGGTITSSIGGLISLYTKPNDVVSIPEYSNLAGLYDQYKVVSMSVKIIPYNVGNESQFGGFIRGNIARCTDWDGTVLPVSITNALEFQDFKLTSSRRTDKITVRIPSKHRTQLNDFNVGYNLANDLVTICYVGDNYQASVVVYFFVKTFTLHCLGRR